MGHASGPSGAGPGTGNPVGPNVIFSPWATSSNYVSVNAGNDQTIYAGYGPSSKTLTPTYTVCGAPNYLWSTGATTPSITVSPITTTVYSITVTDANGHQATDQVTVVVKDFRCGNQNSKILICHKGPNGKRTTLCVSPIVAIVHVLLGGELGACPSATASTGAAMKSGDDENLSKEENKEPLTLKLYPNPTDNQLQLQWKAEAPGQTIINVLDMHGRTVFTQTVMQTKGNNNRQILLPKLANGNYILMMQTGVGIKSVRFIVQH